MFRCAVPNLSNNNCFYKSYAALPLYILTEITFANITGLISSVYADL